MQLKLLTEQATADVKTGRKANVPSLEKINLIRNHGLMTSDEQLKRALLKLSATLERLSG
jgi:ribulose-5-phosphate 4-epimerase/fuculose-1-phosphate aldolase